MRKYGLLPEVVIHSFLFAGEETIFPDPQMEKVVQGLSPGEEKLFTDPQIKRKSKIFGGYGVVLDL